jgi:hypothetical protein
MQPPSSLSWMRCVLCQRLSRIQRACLSLKRMATFAARPPFSMLRASAM